MQTSETFFSSIVVFVSIQRDYSYLKKLEANYSITLILELRENMQNIDKDIANELARETVCFNKTNVVFLTLSQYW